VLNRAMAAVRTVDVVVVVVLVMIAHAALHRLLHDGVAIRVNETATIPRRRPRRPR
jgi:hypothetical protein